MPVTPTTPVVPTDMPVPTLSAEENVAAEDAPAESGEAVIAPFLVQLAAAAVPGSTEGSGDEAMSSTAGAPSTNSSVLQPSAKPGLLTLPDEVPVAPVQTSLTDETPDAGASATAEKAKAAAVASVLEATAQRSASPAGDAALASLRAMPGAQALQQATVTQRKTDAASTGSALATQDDTDDLSISTGKAGVDDSVAADMDLKIGKGLMPVERAAMAAVGGTTDSDLPLPIAAGSTIELLPLLAEALPSAPDSDAPVLPGSAAATAASGAGFASLDTSSLSSLSRATIETTAHLAAQITQRLAGQSTRFELGLTPEGLGRVDVTLDIDSDGQLSARLAFDNPLAATELRGRADDLRRQLEDAGFTVAQDALEFSSRDSSSGGDRRQQRAAAYADRHAAQNDLTEAPPVWSLPSSNMTPRGVDVKV